MTNRARRTSLNLLMAVLAALLAMLASTSAASAAPTTDASPASGGGCANLSAGFGWSIRSCISQSGGLIRPDGYILTKGTAPADCNIHVLLFKSGVGYISNSGNIKCSFIANGGHVLGVNVPVSSGTYTTVIYANWSGHETGQASSPAEFL